ncbi:beta-lactamase/transpeptidase-like protein [Gonapodya prolifera JEL478]|uniref:beta-lactamase n=1 Tax=Gonapodya prolifera (strain JEL478) TaxID=1344416 RepID=A0A139A0J8_GONPJ|nr:beta-lactamase/transpeptidase-like protein [Gonapodya prolifera JEL478]|eukprot:KXS10262.1 beta-lactamase/transpeptidase-like protein [Gonapodya prolifera JEL478]
MPNAGPASVLSELAAIEPSSRGSIGVAASFHAYHSLATAAPPAISFNADQRFPMASTVKVGLAATVLKLIERGELGVAGPAKGKKLALDLVVEVEDFDLCIEYPEIVWGGHLPAFFAVSNLLEMSLTRSDNTATDVLLKLIGGPPTVRKYLDELGVPPAMNPKSNMRDNLWMAYPEVFGEWNAHEPLFHKYSQIERDQPLVAQRYQESTYPPNPAAVEGDVRDSTTPAAYHTFLRLALSAHLSTAPHPSSLSPSMSAYLLAAMSRCLSTERIRGRLRPGVPTSVKGGSVRGNHSEVGVVEVEGRGWITLAIYTRNAPGATEPTPMSIRERTIADVARLVYDYYLIESGRS